MSDEAQRVQGRIEAIVAWVEELVTDWGASRGSDQLLDPSRMSDAVMLLRQLTHAKEKLAEAETAENKRVAERLRG